MSVGLNIRKLRKLRGMTQLELADKVGCTDAAIRNYEKDSRTLKGDTLEKIAEALDVAPMVLRPNEVRTAGDFLYAVLQLEGDLGLMPVKGPDGRMSIGFDHKAAKSPKAQMALEAWQRQREALQAGGLTEDEYDSGKQIWGLRDCYGINRRIPEVRSRPFVRRRGHPSSKDDGRIRTLLPRQSVRRCL